MIGEAMPPLEEELEARKYRAPALEKGLDVLELLSSHGRPMTPSQMSVTLNRSVSELFRMIQVLEFRGYIEQSSDGYRLTNRLFTLGMAQAPVKSLVEAALPAMRALAEATVQSCHLVVPTGEQIVVVARVESPGDLGYSVRIGYRRNLIEATSGRMFYGLGSPSARARLERTLRAQHGDEAFEAFARDADASAAKGYAQRDSDFVKGVTDLSAPVMGADGVIAALILPYIMHATPGCDMNAALVQLRRAAASISSDIGSASQA
ncbi:MAG: helix-turn-helix domain-containing protein [Brevundimonas sp.]